MQTDWPFVSSVLFVRRHMDERELFVRRSSLKVSLSALFDMVPLYSQHHVGFDLVVLIHILYSWSRTRELCGRICPGVSQQRTGTCTTSICRSEPVKRDETATNVTSTQALSSSRALLMKLKQNHLQHIQCLCDWKRYEERLLTDGPQAQVRSNFYNAPCHCLLLYSHV